MDHQARIDAALGKMLRNFNFLELNLGLCLRFLATPSNPEASHNFLKRAGLTEASKRVLKLLEECEHITDTTDFQEWMVRAEKIRHLRNYYVHATWEYLPRNESGPLGFKIPPWWNEKVHDRSNGYIRIEDLEADANLVEKSFNEFMEIRRKYGI